MVLGASSRGSTKTKRQREDRHALKASDARAVPSQKLPLARGACQNEPMTDKGVTCPCNQTVDEWHLAEDDQLHQPFPPTGQLGQEVPIRVKHADGSWHRLQYGVLTEFGS